jgi:hypothetical protein
MENKIFKKIKRKKFLSVHKKYTGESEFIYVYEIPKNSFGVRNGPRKRVTNYKITLSFSKKTDTGKLPKNVYFYKMIKEFEITTPSNNIQVIKQKFNGTIEKKYKNGYRAIGNSYWIATPPPEIHQKGESSEGYNLFQNFNFYLGKKNQIYIYDYSEQGSTQSKITVLNSTVPITSISKKFRLD